MMVDTVDIQLDCISDGTELTDSHLEHQYLRFIWKKMWDFLTQNTKHRYSDEYMISW